MASARRRYAVVGISGNGKTTVSRRLAAKLAIPYVELDSLYHLPGWQEEDRDRFRAKVDEATRGGSWVLDGSYMASIGDIVLPRADTVVWLDQPLPLVLWRLVRRAVRDILTQRDLFNGNRQTWRLAFFVRDSLVSYAVKQHFIRRRTWPDWFRRQRVDVVRLRSPADVERWLAAQ